jgi:GNAT superfamily N-acetyltransferase
MPVRIDRIRDITKHENRIHDIVTESPGCYAIQGAQISDGTWWRAAKLCKSLGYAALLPAQDSFGIRAAELQVMIPRRHQGKGIGPRLIDMVIDYAIGSEVIEGVDALVMHSNPNSARILHILQTRGFQDPLPYLPGAPTDFETLLQGGRDAHLQLKTP